jgi:hypothetical protein
MPSGQSLGYYVTSVYELPSQSPETVLGQGAGRVNDAPRETSISV